MKSKFKGSKTEQMIINAFAGESMARNKYTFYAKQAKDEGLTSGDIYIYNDSKDQRV